MRAELRMASPRPANVHTLALAVSTVYDSGMDSSRCAECRPIYQELQQAFANAKVRLSDQPTTPQEIATWIQRLDEEECARLRETSDLWAAWRRWQEHRAQVEAGTTCQSFSKSPLVDQAECGFISRS
jgi:hypothetical protein